MMRTLYLMLMDEPSDDNVPGYEGEAEICFGGYTKTGQGIFVLHHVILAYPKWGRWSDFQPGIKKREFGIIRTEFAFNVAQKDHPMTAWDMPDETYTMDNVARAVKSCSLPTILKA